MFLTKDKKPYILALKQYDIEGLNFGIVSLMHDDFFIRSGRAGRELTLIELKDHLTNVFLKKKRKYLVLFPEGGFLR